jgi:membrane protease YdiL (CAAX protease family)
MKLKHIFTKVLYFPMTRIVIGLLVCAGLVLVPQSFIKSSLGASSGLSADVSALIAAITLAAMTLLAYASLFRIYEKRTISELSCHGIASNLGLGLALGAVLQALTIYVIFLGGSYAVVSVNPLSFILPPLAMAITTGICEEVLVRGVIFRIMEEGLGSYLSLAISALLFGALHLQNPNSSLVAGLGLAIQAGLLLAAAFIYSRNLWFPIAIHFAWNFTQSAIFGANVSGMGSSKTLVTSQIQGPSLYTGGEFGPEGSIQATLFCLVATALLLHLAHRKGRIIQPFWRRAGCEAPQPLKAGSTHTNSRIGT